MDDSEALDLGKVQQQILGALRRPRRGSGSGSGSGRPAGAYFRNFRDSSAVEAVRQALAAGHPSLAAGAHAIGLDHAAYSFIHKLLTLRGQHIPQRHIDLIDRALAQIDRQGRISSEVRDLTRETLGLWRHKKDDNLPRRQRRLDQTLINIRESCESTRDMEIPRDLSPAAVQEAIKQLAASGELICRLTRRLLGEETSDD